MRQAEERNEDNLHSPMPSGKPPHRLGLHARHAQQVLRVSQVGGELCELRVQMCLCARVR